MVPGKDYGYPGGGTYFGVPISNFLGWAVVGYLMAWAFQIIDGALHRFAVKDFYGRGIAWRFMIGPALYLSVIVFNLSITFYIGEKNIGWAGVFIMLPVVSLMWLLTAAQSGNQNDETAGLHLLDFPESPGPRNFL